MSASSRGLTPSNNRPQTPQTVPISNVSPELIGQFIINQGKQIDLEIKNQETQLKEIELGDKYAHAALQAQVNDRADARKHEREMKKLRYDKWTVGGVSAAVITGATLVGLVAYGQADLAREIITKVGPPVISGLLGILGGYSTGIQKGRKQARDEASEEASQN